MHFRHSFFLSLLITLVFTIQVLFAQNAKITGIVTDHLTGDLLSGANIFLEGTSIGDASDLS